jgi:hypothetical protein
MLVGGGGGRGDRKPQHAGNKKRAKMFGHI